MFPIKTQPYLEAIAQWPKEGQVILAQYDETGIWVYQAFNPTIGSYAVQHQKFLGCDVYSQERMTWIKTNFLWMQYRSGWCTKKDQERCVAIKLKRGFFDHLVRDGVESHEGIANPSRIQNSNVRIQWDPDHDPLGNKCVRRAVQIGLRKEELLEMASGKAVEMIVDMTPFVEEQRRFALDKTLWDQLQVPTENVYVED
eukprot:CAMPEP_0184706090 /NCGR_PEP_ID=MMETSP0313-20130426/36533_1 /TAXON_ID=2792 /ORGANISM="Porphyridium aerugineum, Strain SAG 1380-2" /LENGTH=198 /DNA_ID=CAMNT_0027167625 /DNA_START=46 /DNA_END=642 /DNA_ORIENTATION=+